MKPTKQLHQPIIDLCKNNCAKSQMQLYNLYCKAMLVVAHRYVKDRFIAEDVMQDAFIKAFKYIESYKNEVAFGAWLKRIVINQSIDYLKKNKLELVSINDEVYKVENEENWTIESDISVDGIVETINNLKEKYRLVLTMYLLEGYDHQEIAEVLNITENTSRTHLLRGKKLLKEQLKNTSYAARY
ncbi:sigma-70 family RNA polymerase sigma factor [Polaribacter pectinis]|uniref:Sigma-70 family RNA polymerase sigma factor n=1 Tax=Polaribacter pectinis TaxID=2738844 RepID=A0A7G9LD58_9FLAO|nr:sigma-70 family RNA polymerase sigma factor [Polaribacter pectinis]QNM86557.1 sigma-70 family RNA polymerase sigma factor [Polaribacter pectinis]